jgi:CRP/FNR family transcriptional regulator, anaerobic regulatory protein
MPSIIAPLSMDTDPAQEQLRCFTDRLLKLNEADWVRFRDSFRPIKLVKGEHWLQAGDVCAHVGFVVTGLIHAYYVVKGEQVTQEFYFENTYATSYVSFLTGQPSQRYLQALDDTHLLILSREDLYRFYSGSQDAERMGRLIAEGAFMRFDYRTHQFLLKSPEQRYRDLLNDRPNVMQRVPQKLVASYLGIQPESLSRIRKRIAKG